MSEGANVETDAPVCEPAEAGAPALPAPEAIVPEPPPELAAAAPEAQVDEIRTADEALAEGPASELAPEPEPEPEAAAPDEPEPAEPAETAETAEAADSSDAFDDAAQAADAAETTEASEAAEAEAVADAPAAEEPEEELADEPVREPKPGALALLKLDRIDEDDAYRMRPEGEIDSLATSIARLGQLFPVDLRLKPPDRFQVICGFRRVAALRLLKRERVLARVHTDLSDEEALRTALADLLENKGSSKDDLVALRERLEGEGRLSPSVRETLDRVLSPVEEALGPETVEGSEEEVDLDELAQDIARRLAALNQDLALVAELWAAMDPTLRRSLLEQLAYPEQLAAYLRSV